MAFFAILPEYTFMGLGAGTPDGVEGVDWIEVQTSPDTNQLGWWDYRYDTVSETWRLPFTIQRLKDYRDSFLVQEMEYEKGPDTITFSNDDRTVSAIQGYISRFNAREDAPDVSWSGIYSLNAADMQVMIDMCMTTSDKAFSAYGDVLIHHQSTPLLWWSDAQPIFDLAYV